MRDNKTTTAKFGFRSCGMTTWLCDEQKSFFFSKKQWDSSTEEELVEKLCVFFRSDKKGTLRKDVIPVFLKGMEKVKAFVEKGEWELFASSLLFIYDGDTSETAPEPTVHMIDFAHSFPIKEPGRKDMNYLSGLDSCISFFERILSL